jgi:hypothetical protein
MIDELRPGEIGVTLSWPEVLIAAHGGIMRNVNALKQSLERRDGQSAEATWSNHIEGAAGELAVAKYLNAYWEPTIGRYNADDVGPYQVRTNATRRNDTMVIRPRDKEDRIWISVLSFLPEFVICGWLPGNEMKRPEWLRGSSPGRPQFYAVPRDALRPMAELCDRAPLVPTNSRNGVEAVGEYVRGLDHP